VLLLGQAARALARHGEKELATALVVEAGRCEAGDAQYESLCRQAATVREAAEAFEGDKRLTLLLAAENLFQRAYDLAAGVPPSVRAPGERETGEFDPHGFMGTLATEPGTLHRAAGLAVSTARSMGGSWIVCDRQGQWAHFALHQRHDAERNGWRTVAVVAAPSPLSEAPR
jgi:hypothetical protein